MSVVFEAHPFSSKAADRASVHNSCAGADLCANFVALSCVPFLVPWHFVVHPRTDGELTAFFRWLAHTHAMRWRVAHRTVGYGHLYQGRFKSFPVQSDGHLLAVCRYVERNALSAGLVKRAEQWRWGSLWARMKGSDEQKNLLSPWPVQMPADWTSQVNAAWTGKELARIETSVKRGAPFGGDRWVQATVAKLNLGHTVRPEGRPPRPKEPGRK